MGMTIHYRGRLADLGRIEDFEDRVLDLALELGGLAEIWRSCFPDDPRRVVRGVVLNLMPGQEPMSLLVSPEGWLIGLVDIEDAECSKLAEPPWCFVKTQFGPVEGHVALVELLRALRAEFLPNLEVQDEGGYWETRDLAALVRTHAELQAAIDGLAEGLQRHGLSREAAEDPEILFRRIERVAEQVHRTLRRPAEHPPVEFEEDDNAALDPDREEMTWNELYKHNRRQQQRLQRAIEERLQRGEDHKDALENALCDIGLTVPGDDDPWAAEDDDEPAWRTAGESQAAGDIAKDTSGDDWQADDADWWQGGLASGEHDERRGQGADPFDDPRHRHPLEERAAALYQRVHELFGDADPQCAQSLRTLFDGMGDLVGGLAQALCDRRDADEAPISYGLHIVQLKRALRGAAFARGAVFALQAAAASDACGELQEDLRQIEHDIFHELGRLRSEHRGSDAADDEHEA